MSLAVTGRRAWEIESESGYAAGETFLPIQPEGTTLTLVTQHTCNHCHRLTPFLW